MKYQLHFFKFSKKDAVGWVIPLPLGESQYKIHDSYYAFIRKLEKQYEQTDQYFEPTSYLFLTVNGWEKAVFVGTEYAHFGTKPSETPTVIFTPAKEFLGGILNK